MEGTPAGLHPPDLERTIRGTPGVGDLHDLHAWRISEGFDVVTVHVILDGTRHGPEVAYLESGRNGFVVEDEAQVFAQTALRLLEDPALLQRIRTAAGADARRYTLDNMVQRFVAGIEACLQTPRKC